MKMNLCSIFCKVVRRSAVEPHIAGLAHLEIFLLKDTVRQAALLKRGLRSGITNLAQTAFEVCIQVSGTVKATISHPAQMEGIYKN